MAIFTKKRLILASIFIGLVIIIISIIFLVARRQESQIVTEVSQIDDSEIYIPNSKLYTTYDSVSPKEIIAEGGDVEAMIPTLKVDDYVVGATISQNKEDLIFFSGNADSFVKYDINTGIETKIKIADGSLVNQARGFRWSPVGDAVIVESSKGYSYIDTITGESNKLDSRVFMPVWSPDGKKIAYQFMSIINNTISITISDPDGSDWETIAELDTDEFEHLGGHLIMSWPEENRLLYNYPATGLEGTSMFEVDLLTNEVRKLIEHGDMFGHKYSPDGDKILYTYVDDDPQIWVMDTNGENKLYTGIDSYIEKCVWKLDSKGMICAISSDIWDLKGAGTKDILIEYNLATGETTQLSIFDDKLLLNIFELILSENEETLFFVNSDRKIYSIGLE